MMLHRRPDITDLFEKALEYDRQGDVYNAVKLFKRVAKMAPDWDKPYFHLGSIYKNRNEWKPSFHYSQKATETNPSDEEAWWNLAIAATALKKWPTVQNAWDKLGYEKEAHAQPALIPLRINGHSHAEIVWAKSLDPIRARIESIPHPTSGRRYGEIVLHDRVPSGYRILKQQQLPVFKELERVEKSWFKTYAVILQTNQKSDVEVLDKLCYNEALGFENWSNLNEMHGKSLQKTRKEYYDASFMQKELADFQIIAIAAKKGQVVQRVLNNWHIITLKEYEQLQRLL